MIKHYILSVNPHAQHDWDKCVLRNPITGERPDLTAAIASVVGNESGSYLVAVNIEVQVLEEEGIPQSSEVHNGKGAIAAVKPKKLLAS